MCPFLCCLFPKKEVGQVWEGRGEEAGGTADRASSTAYQDSRRGAGTNVTRAVTASSRGESKRHAGLGEPSGRTPIDGRCRLPPPSPEEHGRPSAQRRRRGGGSAGLGGHPGGEWSARDDRRTTGTLTRLGQLPPSGQTQRGFWPSLLSLASSVMAHSVPARPALWPVLSRFPPALCPFRRWSESPQRQTPWCTMVHCARLAAGIAARHRDHRPPPASPVRCESGRG